MAINDEMICPLFHVLDYCEKRVIGPILALFNSINKNILKIRIDYHTEMK